MLDRLRIFLLHSVRGRIIAGVVILHAALMGLIAFDMVTRQRAFMQEQLAQHGEGLAQALAVNAPSWVISNDVSALEDLVEGLKTVRHLQLALIVDIDGRVRASTDPTLFNLVLDDPASRALLDGKPERRQSWHDGLVDSVARISSGGRPLGFARIVLDTAPVQAELDTVTRKGIEYILLAITFGAIVSWLVVRTMTHRLTRLSAAADEIAGGNLDVAIAPDTQRDEVGRLTRDFDMMVKALVEDRRQRAHAEAALFAEKERAQVTLASIGDAVITTDVCGRVEFLNTVAEQLTGWTSVEAGGRPLAEVFHIINESSRASVDNPVDIVLRGGRIVGLANHTVLIRRDGIELNINDSAAPIRDREGTIIGVVLVFHDVTQAHEMARRMSWAATHDALTGLTNRSEFEHRLSALLESASAERRHTLLYIDLDQFKVVNDTCGHSAGDQLLCQIAAVMHTRMRDSDLLARLGGDEFGVLLENCPASQGQRIAEGMLEAISGFRFVWESKTFNLGASIGLVEIVGDLDTVASLLSAADTACYAAKDQGRNRIQHFSAEDGDVVRRHGEMHWVSRINRAFAEERFRLHYQPIVQLAAKTGQTSHGEVLLRMIDEDGHMVPPNDFIPAAERYNLMQHIDRWVVGHALAWLATPAAAAVQCSINLSGQSVGDERFLDFVTEQIDASGIAASRLCFEITETAAIANLSKAVRFMTALRERGCFFSLDDFGSGLSSFGYLKNLPVDFLKIDGSFVRNIDRNAIDHAMVEAINNIGHVMGIRTIAEFVENEEIIGKLVAMGVDFGQGYALGRPGPIEDVASYSPR